MMLLSYVAFVFLWACTSGMLEPGKIKYTVNVAQSGVLYAAYRSAYNGTLVEVRTHCLNHGADEDNYEVSLVVRSSPCDREYTEELITSTSSKQGESSMLELHYNEPRYAWAYLEYFYLWYLKTEPVQVDCAAGKGSHVPLWTDTKSTWSHEHIIALNASSATSVDTSAPTLISGILKRSGNTPVKKTKRDMDNGTLVSTSVLKSNHPALQLPAHGIYLLIFSVRSTGKWSKTSAVELEIDWKGTHGYLSAIDWPLLPFFGVMCGIYTSFAFIWLILCLRQWKDLLRIQYWIGGVIILGMVEASVFYSECQTLNLRGEEMEGAIEFAEIVSCLKRTLSRMLIIIVSVGFGFVKPRLGSTLHKVVGVGFVYFVLSAIEGVMRVSKVQHASVKQKQLIALPLTAVDVLISWWIFTSLVNTMRALRLRRNEAKLSLYRHFTNTLIFAVLASVVFMAWSLYMHTFTPCLKDWMELWIDTAFWHLLFCVILLVIMILWRPTNNNQMYAFTPLLDSVDDEADDEVVFSEAFSSDAMKIRGKDGGTKRKPADREMSNSLDEDLRWADANIPTSLADKALPVLVDSDEEMKARRFELSKMQ